MDTSQCGVSTSMVNVMYIVYDRNGDLTDIHSYVDVKEILTSPDYAGFFEKRNHGNMDDPNYSKYLNFIGQRSNIRKKEIRPNNPFLKAVSDVHRVSTRSSDFATILGTAKCLFTDIDMFGIHGDVLTANDAGLYYPDPKHVCSHHGDMISIINRYRKKYRTYFKNDYFTHTSIASDVGFSEREQGVADYLWKFRPKAPSSGFLAIFVAVSLGYQHILVHGIPLDKTKHFYDFTELPMVTQFDKFYDKTRRPRILNILKSADVRFSSGRMTKFINLPSRKWINDNNRKTGTDG